MYGGENKSITDGNYNKELAVRCINGTFVGRKKENIIAYRGIPYVGKQPVGNLRWKAPVDVVPDDGVYEAYYNAKSAYGNAALETGSLYYMDEDCLYLNVFKSDDAPARKKPVMVLDEFNIHPAKESEVKIVDWDRTYFLTKYYCI